MLYPKNYARLLKISDCWLDLAQMQSCRKGISVADHFIQMFTRSGSWIPNWAFFCSVSCGYSRQFAFYLSGVQSFLQYSNVINWISQDNLIYWHLKGKRCPVWNILLSAFNENSTLVFLFDWKIQFKSIWSPFQAVLF